MARLFAVFGMLYLSWKPLKSLLLSKRVSDYSFNQWHVANGYAAFGCMTKQRQELIIEGCHDDVITDESQWDEYTFKVKPVLQWIMPCTCAPVDFFMDWIKLNKKNKKKGEASVLRLMGSDSPLQNSSKPPKYLRVKLYEYMFWYDELYLNLQRKNKNNDELWFRNDFQRLKRALKGKQLVIHSKTEYAWWSRRELKTVISDFHLQNHLVTDFLDDDKWLK
ncbi:Protein of unknown function (DUF1222) [Reticulomyxa filosa]|uniref:Lipase maturation factor 1/2 C-terminal domain-containing protein n=1 Tax=Reticulomyxa filosa TaxID=46433 RepID=X6NSQ9_RETFI|nr:Protein of unknown function (DUF1222) [Reticulomyxa filosa]|eukprot:ETO28342.1 Protein of unknown function (DUF1222) [Reticulomyxa filosa]